LRTCKIQVPGALVNNSLHASIVKLQHREFNDLYIYTGKVVDVNNDRAETRRGKYRSR